MYRPGKHRLLVSLALSFVLVGSTQPVQAQDDRSLGDVARANRKQRQSQPPSTTTRATPIREPAADIGPNDLGDYKAQMTDLLLQQDFQHLEQAAGGARSRRSRFPGGVWKLFAIYEAVSDPPGGRAASDSAWNLHLTLLKNWGLQQPESTTARIALAQAYLNYGMKARGTGYANTVNGEGWQLHDARADLAEKALNEAATLPTRCPYWYYAMMQVAMAQGWNRERTRALLDDAIAFEPSFYHTYREYANYLQPKWYGEEGEAEAFAEEISQRLGGDEGAFVYFEIATVLNCAPCGEPVPIRLSWPKIKAGYAALQQLYGTSNLKMNRFAFMTLKARDKQAAKEVFSQIGSNWSPDIWKNQQAFEVAKALAFRP